MKKKIRSLVKAIEQILDVPILLDYQSEEQCENAIMTSLDADSQDLDKAKILVECQRREQDIIFWSRAPIYIVYLLVCLIFLVIAFATHNKYGSNIPIYLSAVVLLITPVHYRLTYYKSRYRYKTTLATVKENLLAIAEKKNITPKGNIPVFFLEELIKKETGRTNVFDCPASRSFYIGQRRWNEKNFNTELPNYQSRKSLKINSDNARTTHIGYVDTLIGYFTSLNEQELITQAENLKDYIISMPLSKK